MWTFLGMLFLIISENVYLILWHLFSITYLKPRQVKSRHSKCLVIFFTLFMNLDAPSKRRRLWQSFKVRSCANIFNFNWYPLHKQIFLKAAKLYGERWELNCRASRQALFLWNRSRKMSIAPSVYTQVA